MMHRMLWWIIIIINFLHQFDVFCKTFCTKIKIRSSKGFKIQDKGCSKSKRDQPSHSCTTTHAIHSLDFLRRGVGGQEDYWFCDIWQKVQNLLLCEKSKLFMFAFYFHPLPPLPHYVCVFLTKDRFVYSLAFPIRKACSCK